MYHRYVQMITLFRIQSDYKLGPHKVDGSRADDQIDGCAGNCSLGQKLKSW
jgi:hypothetical protein